MNIIKRMDEMMKDRLSNEIARNPQVPQHEVGKWVAGEILEEVLRTPIQAKRLSGAVSEQYELEVGECQCGYHFGVDATFLDQVEDFKFNCPSCNKEIDTKGVFPDEN